MGNTGCGVRDLCHLKEGSHNRWRKWGNLPIDVDMRTFYNLLGDVLHAGPSDPFERLGSWIVWGLGMGMLGLVAYAWMAARW